MRKTTDYLSELQDCGIIEEKGTGNDEIRRKNLL